ncbi:MAG: hypothetical protein HY903_21125 [Deltaproteobacteria bacterium]|nr:hypothetical protein [Deltaproteobacteria bacterium]
MPMGDGGKVYRMWIGVALVLATSVTIGCSGSAGVLTGSKDAPDAHPGGDNDNPSEDPLQADAKTADHDRAVADRDGGDATVVEVVPPSNWDGVWDVSGHDGRGAYTGQVEISRHPGERRFTRVIQYTGLTVEDGRELWWLWQSPVSVSDSALTTAVTLQRGAFVRARGTLTRSIAEPPDVVTGSGALLSPTTASADFAGPGVAAHDTWSNRRASTTPIFAGIDRVLKPTHAPIPPATRDALFEAFSSSPSTGDYAGFYNRPEVLPYVDNPEFKAAQHGLFVDRTDLDFYRAHPNALRVVNKVVDDISLLETLSRANAFKDTLAAKAAFFDAEMRTKYIDPGGGMVVSGYVAGAPPLRFPGGDAALWTGCYVASQAFRFQSTGDTAAYDHVVQGVTSLMTLQDITGDSTQFARTLRPATGALTDNWYAGAGPFASLEWKAGGNNDMVKGMFYGYLTGWLTLCDPPTASTAALCAHLAANVETLASDVPVAKAQTRVNSLLSSWLAALVTGSYSWLSKAEAQWVFWEASGLHYISGGTPVDLTTYQDLPFVIDSSGTHLNFVSYTTLMLLATRKPLPLHPSAKNDIRAGIEATWASLHAQRLALWGLAAAAFASDPDPEALADAKLRLREVSCPKTRADVDLRVDPAFVMSPFPSLPWKRDWDQAGGDGRTQALRGVPLFEIGFDDYIWKNGALDYSINSSWREVPGTDFVHAYWFARRFGLLQSTD